MGWVYVDDHWTEHPKLLAAYARTPRAIAAYFSGLAYCRRNATAGLVPAAAVKRLLGWSAKAHRALTDFELWHDAGDGAIEVHDYDEWNRTGETRSASARNAAQVRWERERARRGPDA